MYGPHHHPLLPRRHFLTRVARSFAIATTIILGSLLVGVLGYHALGGLAWLDALVNASMILGGMGPVDRITTTSGKWFAAFYALYSGITLLTTVGILIAPVLHRLMHKFHLEEDELRGKK